jgi:thioredoxin reductase (NADPH)
MLTADEIGAIPLFSTLPRHNLERLAQTSADLRLNTGEFVVREGDDAALFAVISGRLEVMKRIDGVERSLGWRAPGAIFGEVPIALGSAFPGSYRAAEPSRVMRIELRQYYEAAAASHEVSRKLGALARERLGGLQTIAAEPHRPQAILLGPQWDPACGELRRFLALNQISFDWVTPDDTDLAACWPEAPPAEFPAIRLADGQVLVRPRTRELAEALGLQTQPTRTEYDTVIVGAGPAGLAAAVYGASEGLVTMVVEQEAPGGQAGTSSRIENYLGFPSGVSGDELASRALQQARRLGAEILVTRSAVSIDPERRQIVLDGGEVLRARTIVLATGVSWRRLQSEGFERLIGKGVYYGAARSEVAAAQGLDIHLVGAGNSAGQAALYFASHARTVNLVVRGETLERGMSHYLVEQLRARANVTVELNAEVRAAHGETHLAAIDIFNAATNTTRRCDCGGLFIFIGADAETAWLPDEVARDARGYVLTGDEVVKHARWPLERDPYLLETSAPGIFACGDVRLSPVKRVAAAVGEGSMAIALVHQFLRQAAEP